MIDNRGEIFARRDRQQLKIMNCPKCHSNNIRKNGHRRGKQNYQCKNCGRQFIEFYSEVGYSKKIKEDCLTMYVNGNGFRAIERITQVNHNTVIRWVRETGKKISNKNQTYARPVVAQLDELQTFVGKKKPKMGLDSFRQGLFRNFRICHR